MLKSFLELNNDLCKTRLVEYCGDKFSKNFSISQVTGEFVSEWTDVSNRR